MSNAQTQALASKLSKFTSKCREALEDAGISLTHKDNKDRKALADLNPELFKKLRSESGIVMDGGTPT